MNIKLVKSKLLDSQFSKAQSLIEGKIIEGVISKITEKFVFLDCGLKSEPIIDINELKTIGLEKNRNRRQNSCFARTTRG